MDTRIEYLRKLESDLDAAARRAEHGVPAGLPRRRRSLRPFLAAAASLLVVAFGIGWLAQSGGLRTTSSGSSTAAAAPGLPARDAARTEVRSGGDSALQEAPAPMASPAPNDATSTVGNGGGTSPAGQDLTKIVRDGSIAVEIPKGTFEDRSKKVIAIAEGYGGFLLSSDTRGGDSGTYTLRIPAKNFDEAFLAIRELGTVTASSVKGKDVTADFIDLQARVQILKSRRAVLLRLMGEATTIGQTLQIQNQLDNVQLQIEQIQGQLRYLKNQVAESTLKVNLTETGVEIEPKQQDDIRNPSLARAWDRAIQGFLGVLATVVVGLGYLIPVAVLVAIILGVVMLVRRRRPRAT
jgi:hypothetical protein